MESIRDSKSLAIVDGQECPADIAASGETFPPFKVVAASVIGPDHRERGARRQDAFAFDADAARGRVVAVVCDGAGSSPKADVGARIVADTVLAALLAADEPIPPERGDVDATEPWWVIAADAVEQARSALAERAEADGHCDDLSPYQTTLVAAVAAREGVILVHLGDGFGAAVDPRGEDEAQEIAAWERPLAASLPHNGEYANETFFVTLSDWRETLRVTAAGPASVVVLMTDGPEAFALCRGGKGLAGPLWRKVHRYFIRTDAAAAARALAGTLASSDACAASSDDKTILWLWMGE